MLSIGTGRSQYFFTLTLLHVISKRVLASHQKAEQRTDRWRVIWSLRKCSVVSLHDAINQWARWGQ